MTMTLRTRSAKRVAKVSAIKPPTEGPTTACKAVTPK
jgi:hypothetical protein